MAIISLLKCSPKQWGCLLSPWLSPLRFSSISVPQCRLQERALTCWAVLFWKDTVIPLTNTWDPIADPRAVGLISSIGTFLLFLIQSAAYERDRIPSPFREHTTSSQESLFPRAWAPPYRSKQHPLFPFSSS